MALIVEQLMTPYPVVVDAATPVAQQIREWSMVRSDLGYAGDDD